ncbi:MAG: hypothetical protein HY568_02165 [Candidatus Latescibacteria bacterium]|nr:hypothetical protein [Candidatus Latescibacterota bacterium]
MKLPPVLLLLLLAAAAGAAALNSKELSALPAASADPAPFEINLGDPPPPAKADPARVRAVERFLAARQSASLDGTRKADARRMLSAGAKVDDATLAGGTGRRIVAFDFHDAAIDGAGPGRFTVSVYLLFADREGRVAESRDEMLTFSGDRGSYICTALKPTNVMTWDASEIERSADSLQARGALERAEGFLRAWSERQKGMTAHSIEDIYRADAGKLLIPCLRFTARPGKRGYEVIDSPLLASPGPGGFRVEASAQ